MNSFKQFKEYQELMRALDDMLYIRGKLHVVLGDTPIVKELENLRVRMLDILGYKPEIGQG